MAFYWKILQNKINIQQIRQNYELITMIFGIYIYTRTYSFRTI